MSNKTYKAKNGGTWVKSSNGKRTFVSSGGKTHSFDNKKKKKSC